MDLKKTRIILKAWQLWDANCGPMDFFDSSNRYYGRDLNQNDIKKDPRKRELILLAMGLNFLELREAKEAKQAFERCLKEFPESSNKPDFLLNLSYSYILSSQEAKARKSLQMLIDGFPQSEASSKARALMKSL